MHSVLCVERNEATNTQEAIGMVDTLPPGTTHADGDDRMEPTVRAERGPPEPSPDPPECHGCGVPLPWPAVRDDRPMCDECRGEA